MKRKLRLFCDYMASSPLWESWDEHINDYWEEGEYNKSRETLLSFGVSRYTLDLMSCLQRIFEYPACDEEMSDEELQAFISLRDLIVKTLEKEIGDKFEIEVV